MNQGLRASLNGLRMSIETKRNGMFQSINFQPAKLTRFLLAGVFILFFGSIASAQLGVYAFTGVSACPVSNPNVTTQPANATFSAYSSTARCVSIANLHMTDQWPTATTINTTEYNQFTITPAANYLLTLTSLSFTHQTSDNGSGGNTTWVLRSSLDGYTADLGTGTATTTSQTPTVTLPAGTFTNVGAVTFRIYLYRARQTSTTWRNDNVTLNGSVNAIPANPANPTSNSPQCSNPGVTITRSGLPPANVTWYWQTTSTGTSTSNSASTYTATAAGTYYLRARNTITGIWSLGSGSVTVAMSPSVQAPVFAMGTTSNRCAGSATITYTATSANSVSISYSLDGISALTGSSINSATGAVSWSALQLGTAIITATATGCNGPVSSTHTVNVDGDVATPTFNLGASSTRCQGANNVTYTANANNAGSISYALDAASLAAGNTINAGNGIVSYTAGWFGTSTITATAQGCNGPTSASHTATTNPSVTSLAFDLGSSTARCQGIETITYNATANNTTGITYSLDAATLASGTVINPTTGQVTFSATWVGTSTVTATAAGCSPLSTTHTILTRGPVAIPSFTLGASSQRCQAANSVTYTASSQYNTGLNYTLDATSEAAGNTINAANGTVTFVSGWFGTSTITATAQGCFGPQSQTHTVTTNQPVTTPVFTGGSSSTHCQGTPSVAYPATASFTTGINYTLDAASVSGGNSINAANGTVTFAAAWTGTSTVTATAAGCFPKSATHTITITPTVGTPVFTSGSSSSRCQAASTVTYGATAFSTTGITYTLDGPSLAAGNTINAATGAVTFHTNFTGTSTVTASAAGCGGPKTATHTVTTNPPVTTPVFFAGASSNRCQGAGTTTYNATASFATSITYSLDATSLANGNTINTATGAVTFVAGWFGTSTVIVTAQGCYGPLFNSHTITTAATIGTPVFSAGANSSRCQAASTVSYPATAAYTTNLTYTLDAVSEAAGNSINSTTGTIIFDGNWFGTSVITVTANGCGGPKVATHTITTNAPVTTPVFTPGPASVRCQGAGTTIYAATASNTTGLTYSLDATSLSNSNTINALTGAVTWAAGWSGTSTITASAAGCYGPKTAQFVVTITPTVSTPVFAPTISSRCQGAQSIFYTATAANSTSIAYSINAASITAGNSIDANTGELTFTAGYSGLTTVTATAQGCNGPRSATYNVTTTATVGTPVFASGASSTRCQAANSVNYSATATTSTSITYSLDQASIDAGNTINPANGWVVYVDAWFGTSVITATAQGCNGPSTANHTVTITPVVVAPVFNAGAVADRCQGAVTLSYAATAQNTTGITYSISPIGGGNSINSTTGDVTFGSGYFGTLNVIATAAGCSPKSTTFTVVTTATVGLPTFTMGTTSSRCQAAGSVTYTANATTNTGITYELDATSLGAGNTINTATGLVTYVDTWYGTSVITATATGCNGPRSSNHTVTTNAPVTTPVFNLGTNSTRCQGLVDNDYRFDATASNLLGGITYSIDATSFNAGNRIKNGKGEIDWVANWTGVTTITASAPGCYGPRTSTHTVVTIPYVTTPVFAMGNSSVRCQGAGIITYAATSDNTTGITYTLNSASTSGGVTINSSTGEVTYPATWSGTTTITASAAGCSGPRTRTHTVTVTPTVGTPVFSAGASSTRCQAAATVTYGATASNSTSRTYSLDAASTAAGNFINSSNGAVQFTADWVGTSVITVVAEGCNGPSTAQHTVTTNASVGTATFAMGSSSERCRLAETITYTASAPNATAMSYSLDLASRTAGNTINSATGAVTYTATWTGTSTITASASGCGSDLVTHTVTTRAPVGTPTFSSGASSSRCQGGGTVTYTATASANTGLTYSLNPESLSGGNTIDPATGQVTYNPAYSGTSIVTVTANGCFGPRTATHTVTVNPTVGAPVFTDGPSSSRCNGEELVSYPATAGTAITYSLNAAAIAGGNTINSTTGTVSYQAGWVGTAIITARAAGCGSPTTTHTVNVTPSVATPVFAMGPTSSRCQGAGNGVYSATSANSTSIVYTLNSAALSAGNTINNSTGEVRFVATWSGSTIITATAYGCNGPATSTHTVVLSGNGSATFSRGPNSTRVQGAEDVSYAAVANNGNPLTYALDAASIAGGNTINPTTGVVTYAVTWFGTSTISASANGCNGVATTVHTVITRPSSVIKQLYFTDPAQSLDRISPVATNDVTTTTTAAIASGTSISFTQSVALCSPLIIKIGRNIVVRNYINVLSGSMPANPAITAEVKYGATTIITLNNPTFSGGLITWSGALASDVTVPAGEVITVQITNNEPAVSFNIKYDSNTFPSAVDLPVSTYIDVLSLDVYNAPYPGGAIVDRAVSGSTNYIRTVVTDPFGHYDITGLNLTFTPPGNTVTSPVVYTDGCNKVYEYVWTSPTNAGYLEINALAKEGFENTVTASKTLVFSNCIDCPPLAVNDSVTVAGGTPVIINVLFNDTDPNNNINSNSLRILTQPSNGNAILSNGQIVYLPNGTFAGVDSFTYEICDLTTPTALCASAKVYVTVDPTIVDPCAGSAQGHVYYIPYPEQDARNVLISSTAPAFLPIPSNNIRTIISASLSYPGVRMVWDHWEDGYEADIQSPTQATTIIWGDGNIYNGIAPGYPTDVFPEAAKLVLDNTMPANPRNPANFFYDGKDKIYSSSEITLTQVLGEPSIIGVQAMKTNIASTKEFGQQFTIPVGENFNSQDFRHTALFIRASEDGTVINVDKDNNGTFETTTTLNEGQNLIINGGVLTGATVTGSKNIGVDLHFGGVDGYSSREVPIFPATWYSSVYYTPVPTTMAPDTAVVMLYNNLNRPITINWSSGAPASGSIVLPAKTVRRFPLAVSATNAYKFVNPTGESFTAIEIVDSYTPGGGGNSGSTMDWAFNLIAEDRLTTYATLAWAPGSTDGSRNDNPIWVTPAANTRIYVKYNGNVVTGGSLSPCGLRYDFTTTLNALKYIRLRDNSDNDNSGLAVYTCDGTRIAAVYGEDPSTALDANPSWDVGTTIKPFCSIKLIFANDDYAYTITNQSVTIPVLANDTGFMATIDPSTLTIPTYFQPLHGTVSINPNGTFLYTPNPGYVGLDTLYYSICSTPAPIVCDQAMVIININGCPAPINRNIISGQVFLDRNKDGVRNDDNVGFAGVKVYLYADGNCNGTPTANELIDSATVDAGGYYQFLAYPQKIVSDDFSTPANANSCATGSDGTVPWASDWNDTNDGSYPGFCSNNTLADVDIFALAGNFALRLKDNSVSAFRSVNLSGSTAAFLNFKYRRTTPFLFGEDVLVQASTNGSTWNTIYTIAGSGSTTGITDGAYVQVYNLDLRAFAAANTRIRFITDADVDDNDIIYFDDIEINFLQYPMCYITKVNMSSINVEYYASTATENAVTVNFGGACAFQAHYGMARKIISLSGLLFNDADGLTDGVVDGTINGAPSGNTVYAYLVDSTGKVYLRTTVNSVSGTYTFTQAEVGSEYTVVLSTTEVNVGAIPPSSANLPPGWVAVGDAFGTINLAGTGNQTGTPNLSIPVNTGLFNITGINFGIEQLPTAGNGWNEMINPGGNLSATIPPNTFSNIQVSTDVAPGVISGIRISSFPNNTQTITINGVSYSSATFPAAGVYVPANSTGQPTQPILVNPVDGFLKVNIPFYAVDNAGQNSLNIGVAVIRFILDNDRDGIADIYDIDDDNDGITDIIEVCGLGATTFACAPGGLDPANDADDDGVINYKDIDLGALNGRGTIISLDYDDDGVPDFFDLDTDADGIPDVVEAWGVDANGDGVIDNFSDTDGDGLSQNVDNNNSGVAGSGVGLGFIDLDGDGVPNTRDLDSDNDGIPDIIEVGGVDANNDGIVDATTDSDNDGLTNIYDGDADNNATIENVNGPILKTGNDTNNDGKANSYPNKNADYIGYPNPYDLDADGDGLSDAIESGFSGITISNSMVTGARTKGWSNIVDAIATLTPRNSDNRGNPDYLDIDSDDDGITDNIEGFPTYSYKVLSDVDSDGDGLSDIYELALGAFGGSSITPYDHDADGTPDYMDLDTDNDGAPDINEASNYFNLNQSNINTADTDGDGLVDEFDVLDIRALPAGFKFRNNTSNNMGPNGNFDGPTPAGSNVKIIKSQVVGGDRDFRNAQILPLHIVHFSGSLNGNIAMLKWKAENQMGVDYYEVERSFNAQQFERIATVDAIAAETYTYSLNDDLSQANAVNVYYRIKEVNRNGETFYSSVVVLKPGRKIFVDLRVYPNPAHEVVNIMLNSSVADVVEINIVDALGKVVISKTYPVVNGANTYVIPQIKKLQNGLYILIIKTKEDSWSQKIIKQ